MNPKKSAMTSLLKVLEDHSDSDRILTMPELLSYLNSEYSIDIERRTVYRHISDLIDLGYDISTYEENRKGYYLRERLLDKGEIFLLCNSIHASQYIPERASKDIIEKLLSTQSIPVRSEYRDAVYIENTNKTLNKEFLLNIEILSELIRRRKSVSFEYCKYDMNKNLVSKRESRYDVSPYLLVLSDGKTFLVCRSNNHPDQGLTHFRIDKMKSLKPSDSDFINSNKESEDPYVYAKGKTYMYGGEEERVELLCDVAMLDNIIDEFGRDTAILPLDSTHFKAIVHTTKQGMVYKALQYAEHLEITDPPHIKEEVYRIMSEALNRQKIAQR